MGGPFLESPPGFPGRGNAGSCKVKRATGGFGSHRGSFSSASDAPVQPTGRKAEKCRRLFFDFDWAGDFLTTGIDPDGEDAEDFGDWVGEWRPLKI